MVGLKEPTMALFLTSLLVRYQVGGGIGARILETASCQPQRAGMVSVGAALGRGDAYFYHRAVGAFGRDQA